MGLRFRKTVTIFKGLKANISTSGVSFTIGGKGASINTGKRGTYLNLGLPGTGLSYRTKLTGSSAKKKETTKPTTTTAKKLTNKAKDDNQKVVSQFNEVYDQLVNLHKYSNNVVDYESFTSHLVTLSDETARQSFVSLINGNQQLLTMALDNYISSLNPPYDINVSYQIDEHKCYIDVDLPEIESMATEYPVLLKDGELSSKRFTNVKIKEDYSKTVFSLAIYLAANIFNLSPYLTEVIVSGYTQRRDKIGDLVDEYIYSVDFTRDIFENTDLATIDNPYQFILKFANRVSLSMSFVFKGITPIEPENVIELTEQPDNSQQLDFISEALKSLGYKKDEINMAVNELKQMTFESDQQCLKEALSIIKKNRKGE